MNDIPLTVTTLNELIPWLNTELLPWLQHIDNLLILLLFVSCASFASRLFWGR